MPRSIYKQQPATLQVFVKAMGWEVPWRMQEGLFQWCLAHPTPLRGAHKHHWKSHPPLATGGIEVSTHGLPSSEYSKYPHATIVNLLYTVWVEGLPSSYPPPTGPTWHP